MEFDERFQQEFDAEKEELLSPEELRKDHKPTKRVPLRTKEVLWRLLGIPVPGDETRPASVPAAVMQAAADWFHNRMDWGNP